MDGITKGLYGLCVAFCEAHDAATENKPISEQELEELMASKPNGKILENYNKKKSPTDPDMPCLKVQEPCPCWDQAELDSILFSDKEYGSINNVDSCINDTESWSNEFDNEYADVRETGYNPTNTYTAAGYDFTEASFWRSIYGNYACEYREVDPITEENVFRFVSDLPDNACIEAIRARQVAEGLSEQCDGIDLIP